MDKGLRITVGNDVYFDKNPASYRRRSRSPTDDLRNHLRSRMDPYPRFSNDTQHDYQECQSSEDIHREDVNIWIHPDDRPMPKRWSPKKDSFSRSKSGDRYISERDSLNRRKYSPDRHSRNEREPWSPRRNPRTKYASRSSRRPAMDDQHDLHTNRNSRSPYRRQSPYYNRSSHSRSKRHSSSESNGSRNKDNSLNNTGSNAHKSSSKLVRPADDLLMTMYSKSSDVSDHERDDVYLHPILDRNTMHDDKVERMQYGDSRSASRAVVTADGRALSALTEAYGNVSPPPQKFSITEALDDEERYLYGDGPASVSQYSKRYSPTGRELQQQPIRFPELQETKSKSPEPDKTKNVTPGGFDTNALKNVLKAIGFDFELSAQTLQKAAIRKESGTDSKPLTSTQNNSNPAQYNATASFAETIVQPVTYAPAPTELSYQPTYQPGLLQVNQMPPTQSNLYVYPPPVSAYQPPAGIPLPATLPQQMLYQSGLPATAYHSQIQTNSLTQPSQIERPNLKVIQTVPSVEVKPVKEQANKTVEAKSAKLIEEERSARRKRLDYLEVELENLKRKQSDLIRKKKRQVNGSDQELMRQNTLLQAGVEKQIQAIRDAAERAAGIKNESESNSSENSSNMSSDDEEASHEYIDAGNHFCSDCNVSCETVTNFLNHLHSKSHKKLMDPNYKPWYKRNSTNKKSTHGVAVPLKGPQFLLPVNGYYCDLCKTYSGDRVEAEEHCKTTSHNVKYLKFSKKNPNYEKRQKTSALQNVAERIKKLKEENKYEDVPLNKQYQPISNEEQMKKFGSVYKEDVQLHEKSYSVRSSSSRSNSPLYEENRKVSDPKMLRRYQDRSPISHFAPRDHSPFDKRREVSPKSQDQRIYDVQHPNVPKSFEQHNFHRSRERSPRDPTKLNQSRSRSPYKRQPASANRSYNEQSKNMSTKRKFEESSSDHQKRSAKEKRATKRQPRWSPGYDDLETDRERQQEREEKSSSTNRKSGFGFGKFSWKKSDKNSDGKAETEVSGDTNKKLSVKFIGKTQSSGNRITRNKFGNFAPHTTIVKSSQQSSSSESSQHKSSGFKHMSDKSSLAARSRNIRSNKAPTSERPSYANSSSDAAEAKKLKKEPPPPGTEDIFRDDNASDASGISMEIASDEES